ncbi:MAG TPA: SDR family NAD(P)-dependent oxidoreductase [Bacteroidia bacterium]|nr:SDR family NAD(P)-dependent oxidoreductase [Bacteroidia bacterium]HNT79172.1 SDR family NAD(P)-dependent oxidoreductase [Bacteroidia bacterium]
MKKVALITGSSGGLGTALAQGLAKAGYSLALFYLQNEPSPTLLTDQSISLHKVDLRDEDQIQKGINDAIQQHGKIDVLINNAGVNYNAISWKIDLQRWNDTLAVNLTAPLLCSKYVIPIMKQNQFGRIINISSIVASTGVAGASAYAASKSGLWGLTKSLALETAKTNITVNQISPGYFNTGMISELNSEQTNEIINKIPKKILGDPLNIINCLLYLLQEQSNYITGQNIHINGGLY